MSTFILIWRYPLLYYQKKCLYGAFNGLIWAVFAPILKYGRSYSEDALIWRNNYNKNTKKVQSGALNSDIMIFIKLL